MTPHTLSTVCFCSASKPTNLTGMWSITSTRNILETSASSQSKCIINCCAETTLTGCFLLILNVLLFFFLNLLFIIEPDRNPSHPKKIKFAKFKWGWFEFHFTMMCFICHKKSWKGHFESHCALPAAIVYSGEAALLRSLERRKFAARSSSMTTIGDFLCFSTEDKRSYSGLALDWCHLSSKDIPQCLVCPQWSAFLEDRNALHRCRTSI